MSNENTEKLLKLLEESGMFPDNDQDDFSVYPPSAGGTSQADSLKTRVLNVLIHHSPGYEDEFRLMPLHVLNGHLVNLIQNLTVRSPELEILHRNVRAYLESKKPTKTSAVNLKSKLQNILPRYANGNLRRFAAMTLPELQAELRTLMAKTQNPAKKQQIRQAINASKGEREDILRQVSKPSRWTMTKGSPRKTKGRKTRRSKQRK